MSKHTKGPWKWKSDPRMGGFHVYMDTAIRKRSGYDSHHHLELDFSIYPEDGEQWEEAKANARLIAAAPTQNEEMLRYLPIIERAEADPELWQRLTEGTGIATANGYRAAIAKAKGN